MGGGAGGGGGEVEGTSGKTIKTTIISYTLQVKKEHVQEVRSWYAEIRDHHSTQTTTLLNATQASWKLH